MKQPILYVCVTLFLLIYSGGNASAQSYFDGHQQSPYAGVYLTVPTGKVSKKDDDQLKFGFAAGVAIHQCSKNTSYYTRAVPTCTRWILPSRRKASSL